MVLSDLSSIPNSSMGKLYSFALISDDMAATFCSLLWLTNSAACEVEPTSTLITSGPSFLRNDLTCVHTCGCE